MILRFVVLYCYFHIVLGDFNGAGLYSYLKCYLSKSWTVDAGDAILCLPVCFSDLKHLEACYLPTMCMWRGPLSPLCEDETQAERVSRPMS